MTDHKVVSREEWRAARDELLQREKEHTRMADELARQRRELPWVAIEKDYRFDADDGTRTLAGLFDGPAAPGQRVHRRERLAASAIRPVHPEHIRAQIGEDHAAERRWRQARDLNDPDAVQWSHPHSLPNPVP